MTSLAIDDPVLYYDCPVAFTAQCGFDVLAHASEPYVSRLNFQPSLGNALHAIRLTNRHLREATWNPTELAGREGMMYAQYIAAQAFNSGGLGIIHSISHAVSAFYDTHHGLNNAIALPRVWAFNMPVMYERFADIAEVMGVDTHGLSKVQAADQALNAAIRLLRDVGITEKFTDVNQDTHVKNRLGTGPTRSTRAARSSTAAQPPSMRSPTTCSATPARRATRRSAPSRRFVRSSITASTATWTICSPGACLPYPFARWIWETRLVQPISSGPTGSLVTFARDEVSGWRTITTVRHPHSPSSVPSPRVQEPEHHMSETTAASRGHSRLREHHRRDHQPRRGTVRRCRRRHRAVREGRLPRRSTTGDHGVPAGQAGQAATAGGPGGRRQDGIGQDAGNGDRARVAASAVLRGQDETTALYEWDYGKQLLYTQVLREKISQVVADVDTLSEAVDRIGAEESVFFSERFLAPRPLLEAVRSEKPVVLLIDEVDRADEALEAVLLELLAEFQVSVPEIGTFVAKHPRW